MAPIRHLGLSPRELHELVARERWEEWCAAEPALNAVSGLEAIRTLRGEPEDRLLGALLRLASRSGADDLLAAIAVTHQLAGSIRSIARRFWWTTDDDIEGIVTASMWAEIREYDLRKHPRHHGAALTYATRRSVRRAMDTGHSGYRDGFVAPVDPQEWRLDAIHSYAADEPTPLDPDEELQRLLAWALERGHIQDEDVALLHTLIASDRSNPDITKWLRGACSMAAVAEVAAQRGVCAKSVTRARDRVLDRLRQVAPSYLREVA